MVQLCNKGFKTNYDLELICKEFAKAKRIKLSSPEYHGDIKHMIPFDDCDPEHPGCISTLEAWARTVRHTPGNKSDEEICYESLDKGYLLVYLKLMDSKDHDDKSEVLYISKEKRSVFIETGLRNDSDIIFFEDATGTEICKKLTGSTEYATQFTKLTYLVMEQIVPYLGCTINEALTDTIEEYFQDTFKDCKKRICHYFLDKIKYILRR